MRDDFQIANQIPVQTPADSNGPDMSAAEAVMINIFDWDRHAAYDGQRLGWDELKALDKSVAANVRVLCPNMGQSDILSHYSDLLVNRWMGDLAAIRATTERVIDACLRAQNGDRAVMHALSRQLGRTLAYMERNYAETATETDLPVHVVAGAIEASEQGGQYHHAHKQAENFNTMRTLINDLPVGEAKTKRPGLFGFLKPR